MKKAHLSRRDFMKGAALVGASTLLASCAPAAKPTELKSDEIKPTTAPAQQTSSATLRFVTNHGEADVPLFTKVIENFKAKEPNIKIEHLDIADGNAFYDFDQHPGRQQAATRCVVYPHLRRPCIRQQGLDDSLEQHDHPQRR